MTELEQAYERINQLEDLLGCALAHLEGDPCYGNKTAIIGYLQAYWDARKAARGNGQSMITEK
jgi:hypothetical protein